MKQFYIKKKTLPVLNILFTALPASLTYPRTVVSNVQVLTVCTNI
jgi:hypothetical protein